MDIVFNIGLCIFLLFCFFYCQKNEDAVYQWSKQFFKAMSRESAVKQILSIVLKALIVPFFILSAYLVWGIIRFKVILSDLAINEVTSWFLVVAYFFIGEYILLRVLCTRFSIQANKRQNSYDSK